MTEEAVTGRIDRMVQYLSPVLPKYGNRVVVFHRPIKIGTKWTKNDVVSLGSSRFDMRLAGNTNPLSEYGDLEPAPRREKDLVLPEGCVGAYFIDRYTVKFHQGSRRERTFTIIDPESRSPMYCRGEVAMTLKELQEACAAAHIQSEADMYSDLASELSQCGEGALMVPLPWKPKADRVFIVLMPDDVFLGPPVSQQEAS